jgi:hypothetical protein
MTWNSVMGLLSSIALFLPIVAIFALRLATYKTFPALFFYYILAFAYNLLTENYVNANSQVVYVLGLSNNLLDAPLMLGFLTYFSPSPVYTKRIQWLISLFVIFEIVVISITGFNVSAITIILGPGLILTTGACLMIFIRQTKITITHRKAMGRSLISASLLFAYGCYGIIYLLFYIYDSRNAEDSFLIYFLVTTLSSSFLTAGIIAEHRRIKKLHELKTTRKELSYVYSSDKGVKVSRKKVMLDFDAEEWR